jgi:hypothetical protein
LPAGAIGPQDEPGPQDLVAVNQLGERGPQRVPVEVAG